MLAPRAFVWDRRWEGGECFTILIQGGDNKIKYDGNKYKRTKATAAN